MDTIIQWIQQPWPWYVAGPFIALTMTLLVWFGRNFGISSNLRVMCSAMGAGKYSDFFKFNWREERWNLALVIGMILGGFIASSLLMPDTSVAINPELAQGLRDAGIASVDTSFAPTEIFSWDGLFTLRGFIMIVIGGFLIGFGSRYAGGCTSGHAISGLSDLQWPSLVAVIGFFIGGLFITFFVLPHVLQL